MRMSQTWSEHKRKAPQPQDKEFQRSCGSKQKVVEWLTHEQEENGRR